jgi:hypothetical protein
MRNKAISPFIASALLILIGITGIYLGLTVLTPAIDKAKDSAVINEALQNLKLIDEYIKEVTSEGIDSKRTFSLKVTEGTYKVDSTINYINFTYNMKTNLDVSGQRDNINITRSGNDLNLFVSYTKLQIQGSDHLTKGENSVVILYKGTNTTNNYPIIYVGKTLSTTNTINCIGDNVCMDCNSSIVGEEYCDSISDGMGGCIWVWDSISDPDSDGDGYSTHCTQIDCCDSDSNAYPGQTGWFSASRIGCGGYDYNCDGQETKRWTDVAADSGCCNAMVCAPGCCCQACAGGVWSKCVNPEECGSEVPACGATGTFCPGGTTPESGGCICLSESKNQECH